MGGVSQVALGEAHTLILTTSGNLLGAGRIFKDTKYKLEPIIMTERVEEISSGANFIYILTIRGAIYGLGDNSYGQLGKGEKWYWNLRHIYSKRRFVGINCNEKQGFAVDMESAMYGWGECGDQYKFTRAMLYKLIADSTYSESILNPENSNEKENQICYSNRLQKPNTNKVKHVESQSLLRKANIKKKQQSKVPRPVKSVTNSNQLSRKESMCSILRGIRKSP